MPIDLHQYPPNWKEIRRRILARDHHRCQWPGCGKLNHTSYLRTYRRKTKLVRVKLNVCHLDHDPQNWEVADDRLISYCQGHHLQHDRLRNNRLKRYGKDHEGTQYPLFDET